MTNSTTSSGSTADKAMADTKQAAQEMAGTLKTGAQDVLEKVSGEATRAAHKAQDSAADEIKSVASALRTAADELRSGSPQERTFSQLADGLADASDAMRDKDLGEMMGDLNAFARRNPMVFLGGAVLLGFAATRFAKASAPDGYGAHGSTTAQPGGATYAPGHKGDTPPGTAGMTPKPSAAPFEFGKTDASRTPGSTSTIRTGG